MAGKANRRSKGAKMSFTEIEIEAIADHLRSAGFDVPQEWDAEQFGLLAAAVLEALGVHHE